MSILSRLGVRHSLLSFRDGKEGKWAANLVRARSLTVVPLSPGYVRGVNHVGVFFLLFCRCLIRSLHCGCLGARGCVQESLGKGEHPERGRERFGEGGDVVRGYNAARGVVVERGVF